MEDIYVYFQAGKDVVGLVNSGSTCFVYSSIQCLMNLSLLRDFLVSDAYIHAINNSSELKGDVVDVMAHTFKKIATSKTPFACEKLLAALYRYWNGFNGGQQDCFDFLSFLLYAIHEDVKETEAMFGIDRNAVTGMDKIISAWERRSVSPITYVFTLQLLTYTVCSALQCSYSSVNVENTLIWTLEIPDTPVSSLQACLENFASETDVSDAKCPDCSRQNSIRTRRCLGRLPPYLIIHLKRFQQSETSFSKKETYIDFDLHLELEESGVPGLGAKTKYFLSGVINHSGSLSGGHYWDYRKKDNRWYECNDTKISSITVRKVATKAAYVLIFEADSKPFSNLLPLENAEYFEEKYLRKSSSVPEKPLRNQKVVSLQSSKRTRTSSPQFPLKEIPVRAVTGNVDGRPFFDESTVIRPILESKCASPPTQSFVVPPTIPDTGLPFASEQREISSPDPEPPLLVEVCPESKEVSPTLQSSVAAQGNTDKGLPSPDRLLASAETVLSSPHPEQRPSDWTKINLNVHDPVLQEEDIPGAKLPSDPSLCSFPVLQKWLQIRRLPITGLKKDLVERVENHRARGKSGKIDPGFDKGRWHKKKTEAVMNEVGGDASAPAIPRNESCWQAFPSVHIPEGFNDDIIKGYFQDIPSCAYTYTGGVTSGNNIECLADSSNEENDSDEGNYTATGGYTFQDLCRRAFLKCIEKGEQFLSNARVLAVKDTKTHDLYFVRAQVQASMELKIYGIVLVLYRSDGKICYAECGCKAKALHRCGHIAAVMKLIIQHVTKYGHEAITTTGRQCYWRKAAVARDPGIVSEKQYASRKNIQKRRTYDPRATAMIGGATMSRERLLAFREDLRKLPNSLFVYPITIFCKENEGGGSDSSENDLALTAETCSKILWKMNVQASVSSVPFELPNTAPQIHSKKWFRERANRSTASVSKTLLGLTSDKAKINFLRKTVWGLDRFESEAMRYGIKFESKAREDYAAELRLNNSSIATTGMWINPKFPQLACSPDGLIRIPYCSEPVLLEIKVLTKAHIHPETFDTQMSAKERQSFYLVRDADGYIQLKETHQYFYQIQMSLDILEIDWCHLIVWSESGYTCVPVKYSPEFWMEKRVRLIKKHRELVLPEVVLKRTKRRLTPVELDYSPSCDPYFKCPVP